MTRPDIDPADILNALGDPALVVTPKGIVEFANRVADARAGDSLYGADLCRLGGAQVRTFLGRCSGSAAPLIGTIVIPDRRGIPERHRCYGNRLGSSPRDLVFLRCVSPGHDRFSLLTKRLEALNAEVRRHQHTLAVLEEALRERDLLVREVHHRVKNNIQILQGILSASEHEVHSPEAKASLADAGRRVAAMGAVQQALYTSSGSLTFRSEQFLETLLSHLKATWPSDVVIEVEAGPAEIENDAAAPLALIINELVTNAVKHGISPEANVIRVALRADAASLELSIADCGPGFVLEHVAKKSSGVGLVRGLARQLGGSFRVESRGGAHCVLTIPKRGTLQPPRVLLSPGGA